MAVKIEQSWKELLNPEFEKVYFKSLTEYVRDEYKTRTIYPPATRIFAAFDSCPVENTKVVILGQDPYHGPNQANGLCFSVYDGVHIPPSLVNIYKEVEDNFNKKIANNGDLSRWANQGVLLLNATLTVRAGQAGSHQGQGWEKFTDAVIESLANIKDNLVFLLWGSYAQAKGAKIDRDRHLVLEAPHPSPLSAHRGFFGCKHFIKTNAYLIMSGKDPIEW